MCLLIRGVLRQTKLGLVLHILIKLWCDRSKTVLEMHDQNRIIVYRSKSTTNNFYSSAKFVFILGRCFGVLPVHRLAKLPADVQFRWGSLWVVYSLLLASLMVFGIIVSHAHPHESFTLSHWGKSAARTSSSKSTSSSHNNILSLRDRHFNVTSAAGQTLP
jgi:hypothetical protein